MSKKILCAKNFLGPKKFVSKNFLGQDKILSQENTLSQEKSEIFLGPTKILVKKNILPKILGPKYFRLDLSDLTNCNLIELS